LFLSKTIEIVFYKRWLGDQKLSKSQRGMS